MPARPSESAISEYKKCGNNSWLIKIVLLESVNRSVCSPPAVTPLSLLLFTGHSELSQVDLEENHAFVIYLLCAPGQAP